MARRSTPHAPLPSVDTLAAAIAGAARAAFAALRELYPSEELYAFYLFMDAEGGYVLPSAEGEDGLRKTAASYHARKAFAHRSEEELARDLRFNPPDSPYHAAFE